jgi:hypothetical protein
VQTPSPATPINIQLAGTNFASTARVLFNGAQNGITVAAPTSSCPLPTCLTATLPTALLGPFGSTNDIAVLNLPPGGGQAKPALTFKVVAAPPPNDNFANAINVTTLTFNDVHDSSGATTESTDPTPPCVQQFTSAQGNTGGQLNGRYNTIWYKFTPVFPANLEVDTIGSNYDTVLSMWTGSAGSLVNVACNDDIVQGVNIQSQLSGVPLTAGTTYYIMISSFGPPDPNPVALGGKSQFNFSYNGGFNPPANVTSLSPTSVASGGPTFTLTANGGAFFNGATLFFGGIQEVTTFVSATQVTATINASDYALPGTYPISVANPGPGGGSGTGVNFTVALGTYPIPSLNSISPNSVIGGGPNFSIFASGNDFAPDAVLNFNGVAKATTVNGPQALYATVTAGDIATAGTFPVTVTNPSHVGGTSNALQFTVAQPNPVPSISSISPSSAVAGTTKPVSISIIGTNFTTGASAYWNGSGLATTLVSSAQLTSTIDPSLLTTAGTFTITVIDPPPGGYSNPVNFTVTPPPDFTITSSGTTTQTVTAGQTATFTNAVSVAAQNGFSSQVNLSCTLPVAVTTTTTCTVTPNMLASGSGSATVKVTTMARGSAAPLWPRVRFISWPQFLPIFLLTVLLSALLLRLSRTRRQRFAGALPLAGLLLFLMLQAIGCGGGNSTPPPPPPPTGTPAGTYTVTVTATSGTLTHTTTLTLVVQ